ncbi:MAG TPA: hypothetical protein VLS96_15415 [Nodosilinea sp.]|nr:hypothetical protein [Nodosilinea sp.]
MPQLTQGLIVAGLIALLLAVIVGYYLRQGQVNELTEALKQRQQRQEELELEHERRLREATQQLQRDYETQLVEKMERYQAQLEAQRSQLESEYRARQGLVGGPGLGDADGSTEQRIRKQYETRLKEAAAKIQQAYEQHLQEKLVEARSQVQQDYDQRLAEAIARHQDQDQERLAPAGGDLSVSALMPQPGPAAAPDLEARLRAEYDQQLAERVAQYQDEMAQRLAQLEQEHATQLSLAQGRADFTAVPEPSTEELELNLRREIEASLKAEYEQKLAEKIEHYQDELTQRTQELEQSYEARLQVLQLGGLGETAALATDSADFDLEGAIAATNDITLETGPDLDTLVSDDFAAPLAEPTDLGFAAPMAGVPDQSPDHAAGPDELLSLDSDFTAEQPADDFTFDLGTTEGDSDDLMLDLGSTEGSPEGSTLDFGATPMSPEEVMLDLDTTPGDSEDLTLDFGTPADGSEDLSLDFGATAGSPEEVMLDLDATPGNPEDLSLDFGTTAGDSEDLTFDFGAADSSDDSLVLDSDFTAVDFTEAPSGDGLSSLDAAFMADPDFTTEAELDLDALLNAPAPETASDDLLDSLDDISDLS